jgi:hypothetical protein
MVGLIVISVLMLCMPRAAAVLVISEIDDSSDYEIHISMVKDVCDT